jgi:hypothetical protein
MDELVQKLEKQSAQIEEVSRSVNQMKKYMMLTFWITLAVVVLPLVGLLFAIPTLMSGLGALQGL